MRTYYIHDNGGRPFCVCVDKQDLTVYADTNPDSPQYDKVVYQTQFSKLFVGDDPLHISPYWESSFKGNSILAHIKDDLYVWIGYTTYEFKTAPGDSIVRFYSPIGNSDVPYPFARGKKYTYLMLESKYMDNTHLDPKADPYEVYYSPVRIQTRLDGMKGKKKLTQELEIDLETAKKVVKSAKTMKKKVKVKRLNY